MVKLSEITEKTEKIRVSFSEYDIEAEIYVNRVTPAFLNSEPDAINQIKHLVKWWNIEEDDGTVDVEKTAEKLPIQLLTVLLEEIVRVVGIDRKTKNK